MGKRILSYILAVLEMILYFIFASIGLILFAMLIAKFEFLTVIFIILVALLFIGMIITIADDIYRKIK